MVVGVIYDFCLNECFIVMFGGGVKFNGEIIWVINCGFFEDVLLVVSLLS